MGTWNIFWDMVSNFFLSIKVIIRHGLKKKKKFHFFFFCTMERDSACEVIQENIAVFSQLALIECTTNGDLEYFFEYGIEIFFSIEIIIRHRVKKKKISEHFYFQKKKIFVQ